MLAMETAAQTRRERQENCPGVLKNPALQHTAAEMMRRKLQKRHVGGNRPANKRTHCFGNT
jgi:hypothetical protein